MAYYGGEKQEIQAAQELMELGILFTRRADQRDENYRYAIIGEMADVEIMLEQMRQEFNITEDEIENHIDRKITRQKRRIAGGKLKGKA